MLGALNLSLTRAHDPSQLCPDVAMAPWALLCPPGPHRYPSGVQVQGHPVYLPRRTSPLILQVRGQREAQRSRVTHPRSHTQGAIQAGYTPTSIRVPLPPPSIYSALAVHQPLVLHGSMVIAWILLTGWGPAEEVGGPAHTVGVPAAAGVHRTRRARSPDASCADSSPLSTGRWGWAADLGPAPALKRGWS